MATPTYTTSHAWTLPNGWLKDMNPAIQAIDTVLTPHAAILVGGTVNVANTAITANSVIVFNRSLLGGTPGHLSYVLDPGVKVTFNSSSGTDTSTIAYIILKY